MTAPTRIVRPLPCLTCGYSLQGLRTSDRCPECGGPAADARQHLLFLHIDVLRQLRNSARVVAAASLGAPCFYLLLMLTAVVFRFPDPGAVGSLLIGLGFAACPVLAAVGWLSLSRPLSIGAGGAGGGGGAGVAGGDGMGGGLDLSDQRRRRLRLLALAFAAGAVIGLGSLVVQAYWPSDLVPMLIAALAACWTLRNRDALGLVAALGVRAGTPRLARSVRFARWVNSLALASTLLAGMVLYPVIWSFGPPAERALGFATGIAAVTAVLLIALTTAGIAGLTVALSIAIGRVLRLREGDPGEILAPESAA